MGVHTFALTVLAYGLYLLSLFADKPLADVGNILAFPCVMLAYTLDVREGNKLLIKALEALKVAHALLSHAANNKRGES